MNDIPGALYIIGIVGLLILAGEWLAMRKR